MEDNAKQSKHLTPPTSYHWLPATKTGSRQVYTEGMQGIQSYQNPVRFQVLTATSMKFRVFWDVVPCSPLKLTDIPEVLIASIIRGSP
jgi:hypothetical protein